MPLGIHWACGCQQSSPCSPPGEEGPAHLPSTPAPLGAHKTKMLWMRLAQWDKSCPYAASSKYGCNEEGSVVSWTPGSAPALFPSSRDQRLFIEKQEKNHPILKCPFQKVTLQTFPFMKALSSKALKHCTCQQAKPPWGPRSTLDLPQDVTGYVQRRARHKTITDQICSMLLLASGDLRQLLSAFYLTLTKGANCLAKEEGFLILSCCRQLPKQGQRDRKRRGRRRRWCWR